MYAIYHMRKFRSPYLRKKVVGCVRKTTIALATSLTATVVPYARAVCYSAPTCARLAAQQLALTSRHFLLEGARSRY